MSGTVPNETTFPDVPDDVIDPLSRAYNAAYIACAADDSATDWQCSRAALRAVVAHLRAHPEDAAAALGGEAVARTVGPWEPAP